MVTIPTLQQLYTAVLSDLESAYGDNVPAFGKVFIRALAAVQAGKLKLLYLGLADIQKNIAPDTASPEENGGTLERWGRIKLNRDPFTATAGQYVIQVTGTAGATIVANTTFKSDDDSVNPGKLFVLDTTFVLVTPTDEITVRALEGGEGSQLFAAETLTATIPIALVDRAATVLSESVQPLEAETIEEYREKVVASFRTEPQGGAAADYRDWAADAQGVRRVYPFATSGAANEINLYVEATEADSSDGEGTPTPSILAAVEDVVELDPDTTKPLNERGRRPLGVFLVHYLAVNVKQVVITIASFENLTDDIEDAISDAIAEMIDDVRPFVAGADILSERNDIISKNKIIAAIYSANPGSTFGNITLKVAGVSVTSYQFLNGDIPHLNTLTIS